MLIVFLIVVVGLHITFELVVLFILEFDFVRVVVVVIRIVRVVEFDFEIVGDSRTRVHAETVNVLRSADNFNGIDSLVARLECVRAFLEI